MKHLPPPLERRGLRLAVFDALCSALISCALLMDMNVRTWDNYANLWVSLPDAWILTLLALGAFLLLRRARASLPASGAAGKALALFLGAWWVLALSVRETKDIAQPFLSSGQMLKALITALGMACVYDLLIRGLDALLTGGADLPALRDRPLARLYRRGPLAFCMAFVLLAWLPQWISSFPFLANNDTATQIKQLLGLAPIQANHPLFGTMLLGLFIRLGQALGSGGAGLAVYTAVQMLWGAYAVGYSQALMRRLNAPRWLRAGALLLCAFAPVYCDNITVLLKDVPYSYALLLLLCETVRAQALESDAYRRSAGHLLRCWGSCVILLLIRNNGVFVLLPFAAMLLLSALRRRQWARLSLVALALLPPLAVYMAFGAAAGRVVEVDEPVTIREALSLPFQQTARYVTLHGDEIPQEEREIIDSVLDFESLPYRYDPVLSDPVKALCPAGAQLGDVMPYLRVWLRQFLRDPLTHIQATLIQNALLFDPQTYNLAIFQDMCLSDEEARLLNASVPALSRQLLNWENRLHALLNSLPLYLTLNTLGFYCILLLAVCVIAIRHRARGLSLLLVPMLLSMAVIVLGPCIENQDRYGFGIVYCMPLMLCCLRRALRQKSAGA